MRRVALVAGIAQLLAGAYALEPELFGVGRAPVANQFLDRVFRSFFFLEDAILAIFFFLVWRSPASLRLPRMVRLTSLIAGVALAFENQSSILGTIRGVFRSIYYDQDWQYHPFKQLAYVLVPTIPTLAVVSLVGFFFLIYSDSLGASDSAHLATHGAGALRLASFAAAAASVVALALTLYLVVPTYQNPGTSLFRLSVRLFTLLSFTAFFVVLGVNQPSGTPLVTSLKTLDTI